MLVALWYHSINYTNLVVSLASSATMADVKGANPPSVRSEMLVQESAQDYNEMLVQESAQDYNEKHDQNYDGTKDVTTSSASFAQHEQYDDGLETPTEEEMQTLRRVVGHVPWVAYTVAFAEFCERFSYYGTTAVCMLPLPHIISVTPY